MTGPPARRAHWRRLAFALPLAAAVAACSRDAVAPAPPVYCTDTLAASVARSTALGLTPLNAVASPFDHAFATASAEFHVPLSLLRAIGWVETRWQMVQGDEEFPGRPAAHGVMALRGDRLREGAARAGVSVDAARQDPLANIRAAAALLDAWAAQAGIDRSVASAWAPVLERYSGIEAAAGRDAYVRQVRGAAELGLRQLPSGDLATAALPANGTVAALGRSGAATSQTPDMTGNRPNGVSSNLSARASDQPADEDCIEPPPDSVGGAPDYAPAIWRPSPNFNTRPGDTTGVPRMIIIHTCEGAYTGCWSWLVNPVSEVSAHYVVDETGSEISQLVREADRAWHIAAAYRCALNRMADCWLDGVQSNNFTIGIEHAGYASQSSFPSGQIEASAKLVCDITRDRHIPRDWQHIVGHGQLQPENRSDPGAHWPWIEYLHRIQADCGEIVVDDDAAHNDAAVATIQVTGAWIVSDSTPDYYGVGYRWASTTETGDDAVVFSFHLDAAAARTLDVRWTPGANRSTAAPYLVTTTAGDTLATVTKDQTAGGVWHTLGTWDFPAGWNHVALLRRGAPGAVVVADAVRVRAPGS